MDKEWKTVEILRQSRHDWLNKLQLIKGNIELNKIDRAKAVIDEIIMEAQHEARLSNLNMPKLAETLLTANWRSLPIQFELEVISDRKGCIALDEFMAGWMEDLFRVLADTLDDYSENILTVSIDEVQERILRLSFELQGTIKNEAILVDFINTALNENISGTAGKISSEEAIFYIEMYDGDQNTSE
jgi:stage 0 sporulation protein B (sporulation initiation phosphotransferase)